MNFYPHHIGDYRAGTAHLSNEEDLAYRRLIDMYYDTEKPIPLETQWVSRRIRVATEIIQTVLSDFFFAETDGWHHARCDIELAEYHRMAEKNRANGKKGGRPKGSKPAPNKDLNPVGSQSDASGGPVETHWKGNHEPITINQEPNKGESAGAPPAEKKPRAPVIEKPESVDQQVWDDWMSLRKAKKASVTKTVVDAAQAEAEKAGLTLTQFMTIWCLRGSQGLEASWLKPSELAIINSQRQPAASFAERDEQRAADRVSEFTGTSTQRTIIDITPTTLELENGSSD